MKYIFSSNEPGTKGEYPVESFQIAWYSEEFNWDGFDESWIEPEKFDCHDLAYVETEENKDDYDRSRVFANMKNGDTYELILRKVDKTKCNTFYGGAIS